MSRALHVFGAVLVWTVLAVAAAVLFAVGLPLLAVAALLRGVYELGRVLIRRGEMSGADDLDDMLRAQIDGDGEAYSADLMACGCTYAGASVTCDACGWRTCMAHGGATHLCEPARLSDWQHEWPTNQIKPYRLDDSAAEPNELLNEIYAYLESAE